MPLQYDEIHNDYNKLCIGSIDDFEISINEVSIGSRSFSKIGKVKINVYEKEGPVPHFHIEGDGFSCCVCIFDNMYFDHGIHTDTLNKSQCKQLDEFMRERSELDLTRTNWELCKLFWEASNVYFNDNIAMINRYRMMYGDRKQQPDYTDIKGYKKN